MSRYSRHEVLPQIEKEGQQKLCQSSVLVVGCGSLGCLTASLLARSGIRELHLVDRDIVEIQNLQHQILYEEGDIGDAVYSDGFGDPESGWGEMYSETGSSGYGTGIFRVRVESQQWVVWSTAGQEFDDFVLEADAWQDSGPDDASYGLVARYVDTDHFYRFDVGGDGQYAVFESTPDGWADIVDWTESQAILPRRSVNHMRVVCRSSEMSLYVNGTHLITVQDDSLSSGDIGLFGATFDEGGAVLCFDNVKVSTLAD